MIYGFIICTAGFSLVYASLAEMASMWAFSKTKCRIRNPEAKIVVQFTNCRRTIPCKFR